MRMTLLYAIVPPKPSIETLDSFEGFITCDSITCKALDRARRCIEEDSRIIWIEGESGTGKSLLAGAIAQKLTHRFSDPITIYHRTLYDVLKQDVSLQSPHALCIHIPACATLMDIRNLHYHINTYNDCDNEHRHFICFMSFPSHCYHPVVARQISIMKQIYIGQHYEYIILRPLNHRVDDIALIAQDIFKKLSFLYEKTMLNSARVLATYAAKLAALHFEDNVWGLQRACLQMLQHSYIGYMQHSVKQESFAAIPQDKDSSILALLNDEGQLKSFEDLEKQIFQFACEHQGSKSAAARALGIGRTTLYRKSFY